MPASKNAAKNQPFTSSTTQRAAIILAALALPVAVLLALALGFALIFVLSFERSFRAERGIPALLKSLAQLQAFRPPIDFSIACSAPQCLIPLRCSFRCKTMSETSASTPHFHRRRQIFQQAFRFVPPDAGIRDALPIDSAAFPSPFSAPPPPDCSRSSRPRMRLSPLATCSATSRHTAGWRVWSFWLLAWLQSIITCGVSLFFSSLAADFRHRLGRIVHHLVAATQNHVRVRIAAGK